MVPRDELMNKPIKLRNNLIFYLGHIPTFADIHYVRATGSDPSDPAYYHNIFERGIDPDVDNPELCHDHSELPDTWPPLEEMLDYQARVRGRIIDALTPGQASTDRKLARSLWLAFEHEAMHLETFLYMLLQSERVLPPPGHAAPDFAAMALQAGKERSANSWHKIPSTDLVVGLDDPENDNGPDRYFGWDNERPSRKVQVGAFEVQSRPISNGEYSRFLEETNFELLPASWSTKNPNGHLTNGFKSDVHTNGVYTSDQGVASHHFIEGKFVRTVFGLVPLKYTLDWPVMASYDEVASFARWAGGRIPSYEEAKSVHQYAEMRKAESTKMNSSLISAVNG
jgi:L-histidine Nalpha-methyltransferase / hercynylcysteine S-oxide synthase